MEQQLFLMLLLFTYALTILSFLLPHNIVIRLFSALFLIVCALIMLGEPFFYYGFGSQNVITYTASQAGDPGRLGEVSAGRLHGLMGTVQLFYAAWGIVRYAGDQIKRRGNVRIDKVI